MKHLCCPNCGEHVGWGLLLLRAWYWTKWTKWTCPRCGALLQFNLDRRRIVSSLISAAFIILWYIPTFLWDLSVWWFLPVALMQVPMHVVIKGVRLARDDRSGDSIDGRASE